MDEVNPTAVGIALIAVALLGFALRKWGIWPMLLGAMLIVGFFILRASLDSGF